MSYLNKLCVRAINFCTVTYPAFIFENVTYTYSYNCKYMCVNKTIVLSSKCTFSSWFY